MKITFLGTNGWYATRTGNTICTLIESEKYYIVFDAGDGIQNLDKYIKKDKPIYLFLSHLHLDHIYGVHILDKFNLKNKIYILLDEKKEKFLKIIAGPPFTSKLEKAGFRSKIITLPMKTGVLPFPMKYRKIFHAHSCLGFRLELDGKIIVHCLDEGICNNALELSRGADILIHECSNLLGESSGSWGHTNPEQAAKLGRAAGVKKLILTHFAADQYKSLKDRQSAQKIARKIFKNTVVAEDEMVIKV